MKIGILPISSMEKSPNCFPRHTLPRSSSRASAGKDLIWPRLQAFNSFWPWRFAMTTPQKKKLTWQRKSFIIQPLISNLCFQGGPSFCLVDFPCLPGTLKIFARHKPWKMSPEVSWQHGLENHLDKWAEGVGDGQLWLQIRKIASFLWEMLLLYLIFLLEISEAGNFMFEIHWKWKEFMRSDWPERNICIPLHSPRRRTRPNLIKWPTCLEETEARCDCAIQPHQKKHWPPWKNT